MFKLARRHVRFNVIELNKKRDIQVDISFFIQADNGNRTRDLYLTKVTLYRLSHISLVYTRKMVSRNHRMSLYQKENALSTQISCGIDTIQDPIL